MGHSIPTKFDAILLTKNQGGGTVAQLTSLDEAQLPADGEVLAAIEYSSLNYKDALAIIGPWPVMASASL